MQLDNFKLSYDFDWCQNQVKGQSNSNGDALYTQRNQASYRFWPITYRWTTHRVFIAGDPIQRSGKSQNSGSSVISI